MISIRAQCVCLQKESKSDCSLSGAEKTPVKEEKPEIKPEKGSGNTSNTEAGNDSVDIDDKIWADVDKGLDELLREVSFSVY